jgi:hypothetical protein
MNQLGIGCCHRYRVVVDHQVVGHVETPVYPEQGDQARCLLIRVGDHVETVPISQVRAVDTAAHNVHLAAAHHQFDQVGERI